MQVHGVGRKHMYTNKLLLTFSGFLCHKVTVSLSTIAVAVTYSTVVKQKDLTAVFFNNEWFLVRADILGLAHPRS